MELIADGLLIAGALTSALYCWVLSRRLTALKSMDKGLGGAIAGLSARVEQTKASLADTKATTTDLAQELRTLTARAEIAAGRLELLLATLHENQSAATETEPASASETGAQRGPVRATTAASREAGRPLRTSPAPATGGSGKDIVAALRRIVDSERGA